MGQVVGESTAKAEVPKSTPIHPKDLMATVFHVLGIDPHLQFVNPAGRPSTCSPKARSRSPSWSSAHQETLAERDSDGSRGF